jgi:hypothetical protein
MTEREGRRCEMSITHKEVREDGGGRRKCIQANKHYLTVCVCLDTVFHIPLIFEKSLPPFPHPPLD